MEESTSSRSTSSEPCTLQVAPLMYIPRERDVHFRDCPSPTLDDSTDDMSDKEANKPMLFRCLLLLLPVTIPVVVYLKDINAMRRIFVTAFGLLLIIVLSCLFITILRKRRRQFEIQATNREMARDLAHRHFMAMTNRILPRPPLPACGRRYGECEMNDDIRRFHRYHRSTLSRSHYHLTSTTASRSPSPHSNVMGSGPLPLLSLHFQRIEAGREEVHIRCDDPPSYEDVVLCPPETPHRSHRCYSVSPPETPPPSYEVAVG